MRITQTTTYATGKVEHTHVLILQYNYHNYRLLGCS